MAIATICAITCVTTAAQEAGGIDDDFITASNELEGIHGDHVVTLTNEGLSVGSCSDPTIIQSWRIVRRSESDDFLRLDLESGSGEQLPIEFSKSRSLFRGVPIVEFAQISRNSISGLTKITLRQAEKQKTAVRFGYWDYCGNVGYVPGHLNVIFDPKRRTEFEGWVRGQVNSGYLLRGTDESTFAMDNHFSNVAQLFTVPGTEAELIDDLVSQGWMVDYAMVAYPLGPALHVRLPAEFLPLRGNRTVAGANVARSALRAAFPALDERELKITQLRDTKFGVVLFAPMSKVLPQDPTFGEYWIRMSMLITYSIEGRLGAFNWAGHIETGDGFLPKWDRPDPPNETHWRQFQLSDGALHPKRDSSVMVELQHLVLNRHVTLFNGEIFEP